MAPRTSTGWFSRTPSTAVAREGTGRRASLRLEPLEDRTVPSTIEWANRGQSSGETNDRFDQVFGSLAEQARRVVDADLIYWQRVIDKFNYSDGTNTYRISISMNPVSLTPFGENPGSTVGATASPNGYIGGKPSVGSSTINWQSISPNGDSAAGWYLDPSPLENSEFQGTPVNEFVRLPADNLGGADLFTAMLHEVGHAVGYTTLPQLTALTTNTQVVDLLNQPVSVPESTFWRFDGPSVKTLGTSWNSSGGANAPPSSAGGFLHAAPAAASITVGTTTYYGSVDLMNASFTSRSLISDSDALMLKDAYGYTVVKPSVFGTMYDTLDADGTLRISTPDGPSNDQVTVSRSGNTLSVNRKIGSPVPGVDPIGYVFLEYPVSAVTRVQIDTFGGTDAVQLFSLGAVPVVINTGDDDDTIQMQQLGTTTVSLDGGTGQNRLTVTDDADFSLRQDRLDIAGRTAVGLDRIRDVALIAGTRDNTFDVSNYVGKALLYGGGGADKVTTTNNADFILTDTQIRATDFFDALTVIDLVGIRNAVLTAQLFPPVPELEFQSSGTSFEVTGWTGTATLDGSTNGLGGGFDVVRAGNNANFVLTDTSLTRSTGGTFTLLNIESAELTGGAGANAFDVGGWTASDTGTDSGRVFLYGQGGTDTVVVAHNVDFNLTDGALRRTKTLGPQRTIYADVVLDSVENAVLTGGRDVNTFHFENWGGQITLNGGGGADHLRLDDQATAGTAYTVYDNRVTYPRNGRTVNVAYSAFADLTINGGSFPSTFNVESTAAGTATIVNPGPGGATVRVTPVGRTLDQLRGPLTVNGNGVTTLSVNDRDAAPVLGNLLTQASLFTLTDRQLAFQRIRTNLVTGIPALTFAQVAYQNLAGLTVVAPRQTPNTVLRVLNTGGTAQTTLDTSGGAATVLVGDATTNPDAVGDVLIRGNQNTAVTIDDTATVPPFLPAFGYNPRPTYLLTDGRVARTNVVTYSIPSLPGSFATTYRSAIDYGNIGSLDVRGGSSGNVFDVQVQGNVNRPQTTLKAGAGADVVNAGGPDTGLDYVDRLTVVGNTGTVLNLNDQATGYREFPTNSGTRTWSPKPTFRVTNGTVSRTNVVTTNFLEFNFPGQETFNSAITYANLPRLVINGGSNGNVFNVQDTAAGTPVAINAGAGDDVTNLGDAANVMDGIQGPVTVNGQAGTNEVNLNDRGRQEGLAYFVAADAVIRDGVSPFLTFQAVQKLGLSSGREPDYVRVTGTTATTDVTVNAGGGTDEVALGSYGNTLDQILRPVTVSGQGGADRLVLQDDLSAGDHTYTVANTTVGRDGAGVVAYTLVENLTLDAGRGDDQIFVASTSAGATTTLNGGDGNEQFVVQGPAATLDDIRGPLALHGQGGTLNYPFLYDHQSTVGRTYTLTADRVRRTGMADITFDSMGQLLLYTGHAAADTVNIESVAPGVFTPVVVGAGDVVTIGKPVTGGRSMQEVRGAVRVQAFNDEPATVVLDNRADPLPHDTTFGFDPANVLNNFLAGLSPEPVNFILGPTSSLTVRGGTGADTFRLPTTAPGVPLTLQGGGGAGRNSLDYSASTAEVTVNLRTATATGLAGFTGIQDVTGGAGADVLVGTGGNALQGGPGSDILIGGPLASTLLGGTGEDVLIGGTTAHDLVPAALADLQAEWSRTHLPFTARVHDLTRGGGRNGSTVLAPATFTPNGRVNTLTGAAPADLFFGLRSLDADDWNPDQGDVFIEKTTVLGGTLIDARGLDVPSVDLDGVSYDARTPFTRTLTPGSHSLNTPYGSPGIIFTVAADGTIDYNPALEGALTGRGTASLGINGRAVALDATTLDVASVNLDNHSYDATAPLARRLLPGQHFVSTPYGQPALYFTVATDGTVDYASDLDGAFSGRGTATLEATGLAVTLDAGPLDIALLNLDNVSHDATAPIARRLLPGQHFIGTPYGSPSLYFTVATDGTVSYDAVLDGVFAGSGTPNLVINGRVVTLDARPLDAALLNLDNVSRDATAVLTRRLLPGEHFLTTPYHGPAVYFTVADDGTVDYAAALDGALSGRGTADLGVNGREVRIDAGALGVTFLNVDNVSYGATAVLTRRLLPGEHFVTTPYHGPVVPFTVADDGTVDYAAALDGVFTGRGTSELGVAGLAVTFDARALGVATLFVDNVSYDAAAPLVRRLLPGQHFATVSGVTYYFSVSADGLIDYDPALNNALSGRGTTTLVFLNT